MCHLPTSRGICYTAQQTFPKSTKCHMLWVLGWVPDLSRHHLQGPQVSPGLLLRRSLVQAPVSAHTQDPRSGPESASEPAPLPLRAAAPARSRGPARRAAVFAPQPTCAAIRHSPVGGAAAAPATGGGANGGAGGRSAEGPMEPRPAPSPGPSLTASVSWLRCSRSRLCARSSSRWRSVTSLSCCSRARSSEEGVFLVAARGR